MNSTTDLSKRFSSIEELQQYICQQLGSASIDQAAKEAWSIISECSKHDLGRLIALSKEPIPSDFPIQKILSWSQRRSQHEPMAYITGEREFFGRSFKVGPGALIPRPDTETLVEWVIEDHRAQCFSGPGLDLCCGPGTLALTLAAELQLSFIGCDIHHPALEYAAINHQHFKQTDRVSFRQLDLLQDDLGVLPQTDLIVCNPPYIPRKDHQQLMPDVKEHEPAIALVGGEQGLEFFQKLLDRLSTVAKKGCHLYVELGIHQRQVIDTWHHPHWTRSRWREDLAGIDRVVLFIFN